MWVMLIGSQVYLPEPALIGWWHRFTQAFQAVWIDGPGIFLFVAEPLLILLSALIAKEICKLRPKTIYSAPGLMLGSYMFFWLQPVVYGLATGDEWLPYYGYFGSIPLYMGIGQMLFAWRAYLVNWPGAASFSLTMLIANYLLCFFGALLL